QEIRMRESPTIVPTDSEGHSPSSKVGGPHRGGKAQQGLLVPELHRQRIQATRAGEASGGGLATDDMLQLPVASGWLWQSPALVILPRKRPGLRETLWQPSASCSNRGRQALR